MKKPKRARAKSNAELAADILVPRRLDAGPLTERETGHLRRELAELVRLLQCGEANASKQQVAAELIRALTTRHRGRPKQLKVSAENWAFAGSVDWVAARYRAQGHKHPLDAALQDAQNILEEESGKRWEMKALEDQYRKGVADWRRFDVSFARGIDVERRRLESLGSPNGLEQALTASARGDIERAHYERERYERGQRALAKLAQKK